MPTTSQQRCCDTRVPPRERDVAERERERGRELHGEWKEDTEEEERRKTAGRRPQTFCSQRKFDLEHFL